MLQLNRSGNSFGVQISTDELGVWIATDTWTVGIPKDAAKQYASDYLSQSIKNKAHNGFFDTQGRVCFTHKDAKIMLSNEEALALINLITTTYI